ncbi:hypothetical protein C1I99_27010 [Micromonospora deserti]|uniref:Transcriptional regulator n=1 Tax=Micromonospora deserti TaxID=2070366 RepID=A0A2W2CIH2_9ACTN|nr:hypothetical protein C1I99_27010 [Micromonospora deserti]
MHPPHLRARVRALRSPGYNIRSLAQSLSLPYTTVWHWCVDRPEPALIGTALRCFRCSPGVDNPTDRSTYAYLLGLYLGDGHLAVSAKVPVLRIACRPLIPTSSPHEFTNESADIMGLCRWALDLRGVAWRMNRRNSLSVARREAVAALDRHVGPKS